MSFATSVLNYFLGGALAVLLMWRFGPQRRSWHILAMAAAFAANMLAPAGQSMAAHLGFNFATALLLLWGACGLVGRSRWQKPA